MNHLAITRRIRRCESETPAQLVLEHAILEAVRNERERCAKVCENYTGAYEKGKSMESCAAAIRALVVE